MNFEVLPSLEADASLAVITRFSGWSWKLIINRNEEKEEEETLYSKLSERVIETQDSNEVYKFVKKKD